MLRCIAVRHRRLDRVGRERIGVGRARRVRRARLVAAVEGRDGAIGVAGRFRAVGRQVRA